MVAEEEVEAAEAQEVDTEEEAMLAELASREEALAAAVVSQVDMEVFEVAAVGRRTAIQRSPAVCALLSCTTACHLPWPLPLPLPLSAQYQLKDSCPLH